MDKAEGAAPVGLVARQLLSEILMTLLLDVSIDREGGVPGAARITVCSVLKHEPACKWLRDKPNATAARLGRGLKTACAMKCVSCLRTGETFRKIGRVRPTCISSVPIWCRPTTVNVAVESRYRFNMRSETAQACECPQSVLSGILDSQRRLAIEGHG